MKNSEKDEREKERERQGKREKGREKARQTWKECKTVSVRLQELDDPRKEKLYKDYWNVKTMNTCYKCLTAQIINTGGV